MLASRLNLDLTMSHAESGLVEYAIHNRLTPFISMQNQHSATYREEEREMMPVLKYFGVGVIPWSPLAGGRELVLSLWRTRARGWTED